MILLYVLYLLHYAPHTSHSQIYSHSHPPYLYHQYQLLRRFISQHYQYLQLSHRYPQHLSCSLHLCFNQGSQLPSTHLPFLTPLPRQSLCPLFSLNREHSLSREITYLLANSYFLTYLLLLPNTKQDTCGLVNLLLLRTLQE